MAEYKMGDIVALTAGSPRMAVESVEGDMVSTVWCNEGVIHRDSFNAALIKKWEIREAGHKGGNERGGGFRGGGKPYGGEREGGARPYGSAAPKGKPGWDGKPREKKFFRKD